MKKKKTEYPPRMVHVTWLDSCGGDAGWCRYKKGKPTGLICQSAGYLLSESKKAIRLTAHITGKDKKGKFFMKGEMEIPTCSILKIREIK